MEEVAGSVSGESEWWSDATWTTWSETSVREESLFPLLLSEDWTPWSGEAEEEPGPEDAHFLGTLMNTEEILSGSLVEGPAPIPVGTSPDIVFVRYKHCDEEGYKGGTSWRLGGISQVLPSSCTQRQVDWLLAVDDGWHGLVQGFALRGKTAMVVGARPLRAYVVRLFPKPSTVVFVGHFLHLEPEDEQYFRRAHTTQWGHHPALQPDSPLLGVHFTGESVWLLSGVGEGKGTLVVLSRWERCSGGWTPVAFSRRTIPDRILVADDRPEAPDAGRIWCQYLESHYEIYHKSPTETGVLVVQVFWESGLITSSLLPHEKEAAFHTHVGWMGRAGGAEGAWPNSVKLFRSEELEKPALLYGCTYYPARRVWRGAGPSSLSHLALRALPFPKKTIRDPAALTRLGLPHYLALDLHEHCNAASDFHRDYSAARTLHFTRPHTSHHHAPP